MQSVHFGCQSADSWMYCTKKSVASCSFNTLNVCVLIHAVCTLHVDGGQLTMHSVYHNCQSAYSCSLYTFDVRQLHIVKRECWSPDVCTMYTVPSPLAGQAARSFSPPLPPPPTPVPPSLLYFRDYTLLLTLPVFSWIG